jgi:hypothetical protein
MKPAGSLRGELGLVSLFDLGQLLMLNRATGCLTIVSEERKGYLYFGEGRLVNAVDDSFAEGENAAYRVFTWRTGSFDFVNEPLGGSTTIEIGTDALMLEAARRLDETAEQTGDATASGQAARLRENQLALEALREEFHRVTGEARTEYAATDARSAIAPLYALSWPGDRLVYRAGRPPRRRQRGEWQETGEPPLTEAAYEDLRLRMLQACTAASAVASGASATRRVQLADGRVVAVEFVNEGPDESMWMRLVDLPAPDPARLEGDVEELGEILDLPGGLIVAGGADPGSMRRLLHSLARALAERHGDTVLFASADETFSHIDEAGLVLRTAPALLRRSIAALEPGTVVLDPTSATGEVMPEDLERVPRLLVGAIAPQPEALATRCLARLSLGGLERARASFGALPIAVVWAAPDSENDPDLRFDCWQLGDKDRALAFAGDVTALAARLRPGAARSPRTPLPTR